MSIAVASLDDLERVVARLAQAPRPIAVNRTDAARLLAVSPSTFDRMVKEGTVHPIPGMHPARFSVLRLEEFAAGLDPWGQISTSSGHVPNNGGRAAPGDVDGPSGPTGGGDSVTPLSPLQLARQAGGRGPSSTARGDTTPPAA